MMFMAPIAMRFAGDRSEFLFVPDPDQDAAFDLQLLSGIGGDLPFEIRLLQRASIDCRTSSRSRTSVIRLQRRSSILPVRSPKVCLNLEVHGALTAINLAYKVGFLGQ